LIIRKTDHESQSKLKNIEHVLCVFMLYLIMSQETTSQNNIRLEKGTLNSNSNISINPKSICIGYELFTPKFHLCFLDQL